MRGFSTLAAISAAVMLVTACAQKPASSDRGTASNSAFTETVTAEIYDRLMTRILKDETGRVDNGGTVQSGERNPYRTGIPGFPHKALAACLNWDVPRLRYGYRGWNIYVSSDWSDAEFNALKRCRRANYENCTCQVIDHDDENVLEVPADFLEKYEERFSASAN